ncbi:WhiB family transcriptional regulator [Flexivirga sp.]|uniref:WhiB family transcriptional regulator n=1 Tax=Flexivirga sp. TaxID=1962927 RepID=UPI003F80D3B9
MNARERLAVEIVSLAPGERLPCGSSDRALWTSEDATERARAARACLACPVVVACCEAGADETTGVWGGVDREASDAGAVRECRADAA